MIDISQARLWLKKQNKRTSFTSNVHFAESLEIKTLNRLFQSFWQCYNTKGEIENKSWKVSVTVEKLLNWNTTNVFLSITYSEKTKGKGKYKVSQEHHHHPVVFSELKRRTYKKKFHLEWKVSTATSCPRKNFLWRKSQVRATLWKKKPQFLLAINLRIQHLEPNFPGAIIFVKKASTFHQTELPFWKSSPLRLITSRLLESQVCQKSSVVSHSLFLQSHQFIFDKSTTSNFLTSFT